MSQNLDSELNLSNYLKTVNWSDKPEEVTTVFINNLKALQEKIPESVIQTPHLRPGEGSYDFIVIPSGEKFSVIPDSHSNSRYAIPIGSKLQITDPRPYGPDHVVNITLTNDPDTKIGEVCGTKIIIKKDGNCPDDEKNFIEKIIKDNDLLETYDIQKRKSLHLNLDLDAVLKKDIELDALYNEAVEIKTEAFKEINPNLESSCDIPIKFGRLSFCILGVDSQFGFLIIQTPWNFDVQVSDEVIQ